MNINFDDLLLGAEHLAGFLIVLVALALLWGLTEILGRVLRPSYTQALPATAAAPVPADGGSPGSELVPDDVAVIAAAVAYLIDEPHHIVSVRPQASSWGQQGRRDIHASHRIR